MAGPQRGLVFLVAMAYDSPQLRRKKGMNIAAIKIPNIHRHMAIPAAISTIAFILCYTWRFSPGRIPHCESINYEEHTHGQNYGYNGIRVVRHGPLIQSGFMWNWSGRRFECKYWTLVLIGLAMIIYGRSYCTFAKSSISSPI